MKTVRTAAELIAKYDRPNRPWTKLFRRVEADGKLSGKETGLNTRASRVGEFVEDLHGLGDDEFVKAVDALEDDAATVYLYNRYPRFFTKWDNGRLFNGVIIEVSRRDGSIDSDEIDIAGGMAAFVAEMHETFDARDFELATRVEFVVGKRTAKEFTAAVEKLRLELRLGD